MVLLGSAEIKYTFFFFSFFFYSYNGLVKLVNAEAESRDGVYNLWRRKQFCSQQVFSSHDNTEQSSEYLNKQAEQDTHPHLLEFFLYLKHTGFKTRALILDPECQMLGAVGKQPAPAHSLWCAPISTPDCKSCWHQAVKSQLWGSLYFYVFYVFGNQSCSMCSMQWVWSLGGVCQCVVLAVNNCCAAASTRTPMEWQVACSAERFSNMSPEVCCFGLHSHP